jgi:alpha-ketoglutarate-dependent taurine dioxygenase
MCWKNPVTGRLALQVHPSAVRKLHLKDGSIIDDLRKVRDIIYRLQRPGIAPELVYCHDWEEGDLVLFNNQGTIHSVVGAFAPDEVRIFRQCNLASSAPPKGPEESESQEAWTQPLRVYEPTKGTQKVAEQAWMKPMRAC